VALRQHFRDGGRRTEVSVDLENLSSGKRMGIEQVDSGNVLNQFLK